MLYRKEQLQKLKTHSGTLFGRQLGKDYFIELSSADYIDVWHDQEGLWYATNLQKEKIIVCELLEV